MVARILAKGVMHRVFRVPVDFRGLHLFVVRIEDADVVVRQVVGLVLHDRDQVFPYDRHRHGPVRIEVYLHDLAVDVGRRPIDLADHGRMPRHRDVILDSLDASGRNVDHHVARAEISWSVS